MSPSCVSMCMYCHCCDDVTDIEHWNQSLPAVHESYSASHLISGALFLVAPKKIVTKHIKTQFSGKYTST